MNVTTANSTTGAVSDRGRHFGSFREYVEALKAIGEVQEIEREVDWNLEMGAIIMRTTQNKLPAPLFNKVKDAEAGLRALGAPAAASRQPGLCFARLALMMGMDPHSALWNWSRPIWLRKRGRSCGRVSCKRKELLASSTSGSEMTST